MFLDEMIEKAYQDNINDEAYAAVAAISVAIKAIPQNPTVNDYKHAHYAWRAFARRHSETISPDGFKNTLIHYIPERKDYIESILK